MAYEDKTLKDLMDEIRKMEQPEPKKTGVFWEDILDEEPAVAEKTPSINLDVCIRDTLEDLRLYRLSAAGENIIREFLTFRVQTRQSAWDQPEAHRAYYNLLIHGEEKESIRAVADILRQALDIPPRDTMIQTEAELLQQMDAASRTPRRSKESLIPNGVRFVLIDACKDAPQMNMDGGSAVRDANRKAMENYRAMWKAVISHIRANPETILLVGCEESVYRNTMCPFIELSQRICGHHIHLIPRSEDDLLADCMAELKRSSFALSDDFEPTLAEYFHNAYRSSDLRSQAFVADLLDRIFALYYSRQRDSLTLTADCVPVFDYLTQSVESVLGQLEQLIGLETVKSEFSNIYKMQVAGLADRENSHYHMVFTGNPGTGKTTVARMAADLFHRMGVLKTNKLVAVKPSDLISEWIGGTGIKAMEVIRRAYNGVLFIDEAYGIANMDRGEELLNVLLQEMENNADKLIVILAGYTDEMRELLKTNPGLGSRIGQEIHFADYSQEELARIFLQMCKKSGFSLDDSARDELDDCIGALMTREFFGNARDIRNMLQDLKEVWSEDFYTAVTQNGVDAEDFPRVFLPHHFEKIMPPKKEVSIQDLIGLEVLKNKLDVFKRQAMYQKHLREKGFTNLSDFSMHMIFTGNPGTGKTTVAEYIGKIFHSLGLLSKGEVIRTERTKLVGRYIGETERNMQRILEQARGNVLFIDEAYTLCDTEEDRKDFGSHVIDALLTVLAQPNPDMLVIMAGYKHEMDKMMNVNIGLEGRFPHKFHFEDYTADELMQIATTTLVKSDYMLEADAHDMLMEGIIETCANKDSHFSNARWILQTVANGILPAMSTRIMNGASVLDRETLSTIKAEDVAIALSEFKYVPAMSIPRRNRIGFAV